MLFRRQKKGAYLTEGVHVSEKQIHIIYLCYFTEILIL